MKYAMYTITLLASFVLVANCSQGKKSEGKKSEGKKKTGSGNSNQPAGGMNAGGGGMNAGGGGMNAGGGVGVSASQCGDDCKARKLARFRRERCDDYKRRKVIADNKFRELTDVCWNRDTGKYIDVCKNEEVRPPHKGVWTDDAVDVKASKLFPMWSYVGGTKTKRVDLDCKVIPIELLSYTGKRFRKRRIFRRRGMRTYHRNSDSGSSGSGPSAVASRSGDGPTAYDLKQDAKIAANKRRLDVHGRRLSTAERKIARHEASWQAFAKQNKQARSILNSLRK